MLYVIGIGSPFGDDRIGWLMIEELRRSERVKPYLGCKVELTGMDRPGAELLPMLEGKSHVILIDAVITGGMAGELHHWTDPSILEDVNIARSSHGFGLAQTLALGHALDALPRTLHILGIEIDPTTAVDELSPQLSHQLPMLTDRLVDVLLSECGPEA